MISVRSTKVFFPFFFVFFWLTAVLEMFYPKLFFFFFVDVRSTKRLSKIVLHFWLTAVPQKFYPKLFYLLVDVRSTKVFSNGTCHNCILLHCPERNTNRKQFYKKQFDLKAIKFQRKEIRDSFVSSLHLYIKCG